MKKIYLFKTLLLLCALMAGSGSAWATEEVTVTKTTNQLVSANGWKVSSGSTVNDIITSFSLDDNITISTSGDANCGSIWGSSTYEWRLYQNKGGDVTVTAANGFTLKSVTFTYGISNSGTLKDGNTTIASDSEVSLSGTTKTFTVGNTGSATNGQVRITQFSVTYELPAADNRTPVNLESFSATTTTLVKGGTTTTTVTNDQEGWTAAYTYSSDDEDVATIDANGEITAVGKGSTKVWASLNVDSEDPNYKKGVTYTKSIDITVNNPSHNVVFSVRGNLSEPQSVEEGASIPFPTNISDFGGKKFMGWTNAVIVGTLDDAPETLITTATMGTTDITYYAVYATENVTVNVFTKTYGFESESNEDWTVTGAITRSNDYANSGSYSGKINTNDTYITFKNKVNVTEFSYAFTRTSKNDNYNVYIETSENKSSWTAAQTNAMSSFNSDGTFKTVTKTFDGTNELYVRFHCNNTTAVRYVDDVTIKYKATATSYSDYCTSITTQVKVTSAEYATFHYDYAVDFSESGIKAYTAQDGENYVKLNEITSGKVPANTCVVLYKAGGGTVDVPVIASAEAPEGTNDLHVVGEGGLTGEDYIYVLAKPADKVGFFLWDKTQTLNEGKIYLQGKESYGARLFLGFNEAQGIDATLMNNETMNNVVFDLQGRRVAKAAKGLYIMDGKKVLVK